MRSERVTVTMPAGEAERLRRAVARSGAESVSAYVTRAVHDRLERDEALDALDQIWGELPAESLVWARTALGVDRRDQADRPARAS